MTAPANDPLDLDHAHKLGQEAARTGLPVFCFDVPALLARDLGRSPTKGELRAFRAGWTQAARAQSWR